MRKSEFDNFELLLITAAEASANDLADELMTVDTSDITISPKSYAKAQRYIRKYRRRTNPWKTAKIVLVACLIAMSIGFTACMIVPQIREAIKNVVVQWCDNYLAVDFSDEPPAQTTATAPEDPIPATPPTEIEQKAYAAYLPQKYTTEIIADTLSFYQQNYCSSDGTLIFMLKQKVIEGEMEWIDDGGILDKNTTVNGHKAFFVSYPEFPGEYVLIWQDYYYQYTLYGCFESKEELIKIAENIKLW